MVRAIEIWPYEPHSFSQTTPAMSHTAVKEEGRRSQGTVNAAFVFAFVTAVTPGLSTEAYQTNRRHCKEKADVHVIANHGCDAFHCIRHGRPDQDQRARDRAEPDTAGFDLARRQHTSASARPTRWLSDFRRSPFLGAMSCLLEQQTAPMLYQHTRVLGVVIDR